MTTAAKVGRLRVRHSSKLTPKVRRQIAQIDRLYLIRKRAKALREMGVI